MLFLREREFPEVVARLLAGAPAGLGPLGLAMHGLEMVAAGDLEGWRGEIAARRAVVLSEPALRERELLKSAVLTDAIGGRAGRDGRPGRDASLAARTASGPLRSSLEADWIAGPDDVLLVDVVRAARRRLDRLVVGRGLPSTCRSATGPLVRPCTALLGLARPCSALLGPSLGS